MVAVRQVVATPRRARDVQRLHPAPGSRAGPRTGDRARSGLYTTWRAESPTNRFGWRAGTRCGRARAAVRAAADPPLPRAASPRMFPYRGRRTARDRMGGAERTITSRAYTQPSIVASRLARIGCLDDARLRSGLRSLAASRRSLDPAPDALRAVASTGMRKPPRVAVDGGTLVGASGSGRARRLVPASGSTGWSFSCRWLGTRCDRGTAVQ